jgi:hypothetical protein
MAGSAVDLSIENQFQTDIEVDDVGGVLVLALDDAAAYSLSEALACAALFFDKTSRPRSAEWCRRQSKLVGGAWEIM